MTAFRSSTSLSIEIIRLKPFIGLSFENLGIKGFSVGCHLTWATFITIANTTATANIGRQLISTDPMAPFTNAEA